MPNFSPFIEPRETEIKFSSFFSPPPTPYLFTNQAKKNSKAIESHLHSMENHRLDADISRPKRKVSREFTPDGSTIASPSYHKKRSRPTASWEHQLKRKLATYLDTEADVDEGFEDNEEDDDSELKEFLQDSESWTRSLSPDIPTRHFQSSIQDEAEELERITQQYDIRARLEKPVASTWYKERPRCSWIWSSTDIDPLADSQ
ncbi:hypothetical protein K438DRAFT_2150168 [Mycena galopus ATCC 62051]|nr:hypothetical protein K438DRAFT_2150168 [Mycena galopus ATCC 62051]